jgi:hypothetical protein
MAGLSHLGVQPRFVSPEQLENGALRSATAADEAPLVLVLAHAIALSDREAAEITAFAASGGMVLADAQPGAEPGRYDAHGRRRDVAALAPPVFAPMPAGPALLAATLARAGAPPRLLLLNADGTAVRDVQIHLFRNGGVTLVGLQRDLAAAGAATQRLVLELPGPEVLHDLRTGQMQEASVRHEISLSADAPTLFALAAARLPSPAVSGPRELAAGGTAVWRIVMNGNSPAAAHALHVDVIGPDGAVSPLYSGNLVLRGRAVVWPVPFAANDASGAWQIRVTDRLGGGVAVGGVDLK